MDMILKGSILLLLLIICHDRIRKSIVTGVADEEYDYIIGKFGGELLSKWNLYRRRALDCRQY